MAMTDDTMATAEDDRTRSSRRGWERGVKATPSPPPRLSVPTKDAGDLSGGVGIADWRPQPLHRGCRYPRRTPTTSVDGSGSPIGAPNPESIGDLRLEVLDRFGIVAANRLL
ncbi:hypothetical protein CRG98_045849 [Punica granatum]|uniref:Uncharacterized protein n=1 Tax=Punica granatum TaxID=22663 RepID=A0A2I0HQL5_PUNGR|nr:hypothetical protein CRG98_045849 [Punica granatum]